MTTTILLVENDEKWASRLCDMYTRIVREVLDDDPSVTMASTVDEACYRLGKSTYDLLSLDINMTPTEGATATSSDGRDVAYTAIGKKAPPRKRLRKGWKRVTAAVVISAAVTDEKLGEALEDPDEFSITIDAEVRDWFGETRSQTYHKGDPPDPVKRIPVIETDLRKRIKKMLKPDGIKITVSGSFDEPEVFVRRTDVRAPRTDCKCWLRPGAKGCSNAARLLVRLAHHKVMRAKPFVSIEECRTRLDHTGKINSAIDEAKKYVLRALDLENHPDVLWEVKGGVWLREEVQVQGVHPLFFGDRDPLRMKAQLVKEDLVLEVATRNRSAAKRVLTAGDAELAYFMHVDTEKEPPSYNDEAVVDFRRRLEEHLYPISESLVIEDQGRAVIASDDCTLDDQTTTTRKRSEKGEAVRPDTADSRSVDFADEIEAEEATRIINAISDPNAQGLARVLDRYDILDTKAIEREPEKVKKILSTMYPESRAQAHEDLLQVLKALGAYSKGGRAGGARSSGIDKLG